MRNFMATAILIFGAAAPAFGADFCTDTGGKLPAGVINRTYLGSPTVQGWWQARALYDAKGNYDGDRFELQNRGAALPHTSWGSHEAYFVEGAVKFLRNPKNNAGYTSVRAKTGKLGGTNGFEVQSQATVDAKKQNRSVGVYVGEEAESMGFFYPHPDQTVDAKVTPLVIENDGAMKIRGPGRSTASFAVTSDGRAGVGVDKPTANLDVNGLVRLQKFSKPPRTCNEVTKGTLALSSGYVLCLCNGKKWAKSGASGNCPW